MVETTGAIAFRETGGPEVLRWETLPIAAPAPGEVRLRHTAIGFNFHDTYVRSGLYPAPSLPAVPGVEAAGIVEAVGEGVGELCPGDRVAYASPLLGAYAERRLLPAASLVKLPDDLPDERAAGLMVKGMTAHYLLRRSHRVKKGEIILVHAAAGGVGLILCQWAKHLGATVLGTVGSRAKAELAARHGCDHPILYREEDFVARVREVTNGAGVAAVYDSVGRDTFAGSLDCLQHLGIMISFGQSSGKIPPFDVIELMAKGSLFLTRPSLFTYIAKREDLLGTAADVFDAVRNGVFTIDIRKTYALRDAADAHRDIEARRTTGASIFRP
ncbi:MAG: quinone oxidoreductase [Alphaproteobacteria bacterium]|nr:quinone oxidoreductase [Alphaproteobacteria bacterium]